MVLLIFGFPVVGLGNWVEVIAIDANYFPACSTMGMFVGTSKYSISSTLILTIRERTFITLQIKHTQSKDLGMAGEITDRASSRITYLQF
ncbi:hypothetical protein OROMI_021160 [Orobanche minor]